MYAWIWHYLPGSTPVKVVEAVCLAVAVVALLLFVVFPWVSSTLLYSDPTLG